MTLNSRRILTGTAAVALVAFLGSVMVGSLRSDGTFAPERVLRRIDLVASVDSMQADAAWSQVGGRTSGGQARLALDDLRTVTIHDQTLVDDYSSVPACQDLSTPNACVLLADMLGEAVVWFALVPADSASGREFLTLPGLIDMQSNGDEGILRNGWVVKLANGVRRECGDVDTTSLRDFITRYPDSASTSLVDMVADKVVRVDCVEP